MMADRLSQERRSWNMSRIGARNTKPEMMLRSCLFRAGLRFRTHSTALPGTPDIVLTRYRTVIFVHGCFWHRHQGCPHAAEPKSNVDFWQRKFESTVARDARNAHALRSLGWHVITVWECEINQNAEGAARHIRDQLTMRG